MTNKIKGIPTLTTVRAVLTTRWGKSGYRPHVVKAVEAYYVDTALDNDADTWSIEIGDPDGELMSMLRRDSEVRVNLFGYTPKGSEPILTGIADELQFTENGTWSITGRDLSALAMDSTIPPQFYRQAKAVTLVRRQALNLGFTKFNLATGLGGQKIVKKTQHTDGNETYWEFWYRLYRKERMWIWTEPDGTLVANNLNYSGPPFYYFGTPRGSDSRSVKQQHLPVEHVAISKNTQQRFEEVWVYWSHGDNSFLAKQSDPNISEWQNKRFKIVHDTDALTAKSANKTALEEIFEGKVGEIEWKINVPDPGFEIHQNRIARLRIPEIGVDGDMFVVGVRRSGGSGGVVLEIRLRERHYAITRRVPKDPKLKKDKPGPTGTDILTEDLPGISGMPDAWAPHFLKAARKWSGPWDFNFFLALLLGICDVETGFSNIRRNGGPGGSGIPWYEWHGKGSESPNRPPGQRDPYGRSLDEWKEIFANEPGKDNASVYIGSETFAVGAMQLYSEIYKYYADNLLKQDNHDQWFGGRWHIEHNIMGGAFALRDKLNGRNADPSDNNSVWPAVGDYGEGPAYAQKVKVKVLVDPNYLQQVKDSRARAVEEAAGDTDPGGDGDSDAPFTNSPEDLKKLTHIAPRDSGVDLVHVNYTLLFRLNAYGKAYNKKITINSGYRSLKEQQDLWDSHVRTGIPKVVANPANGPSNHQRGEACDCDIYPPAPGAPGPDMGYEPLVTLTKYKIHPSVLITRGDDAVHMTRIEVWG